MKTRVLLFAAWAPSTRKITARGDVAGRTRVYVRCIRKIHGVIYGHVYCLDDAIAANSPSFVVLKLDASQARRKVTVAVDACPNNDGVVVVVITHKSLKRLAASDSCVHNFQIAPRARVYGSTLSVKDIPAIVFQQTSSHEGVCGAVF